MKRKTRIRLLLSILFFLFFFAALINLAPIFLNVNNYKGLIEKKLSDYTRSSVSIGDIQFAIRNGIELELNNVSIKENELSIFSAKRIKTLIKLTPLIKQKTIVIRSLYIEGADISANRDREGYFNISRIISNYTTPLLELKAEKEGGYLLEDKKSIFSPLNRFLTTLQFKFIPMLSDVRVIDSRLIFTDSFIPETSVPVEFNKLNMIIEKPLFREMIKFKVNGILSNEYQPSTFELTGTVKDSSQNVDYAELQHHFINFYLTNFNWGGHIKINSLPLNRFSDYLKKYLPAELSAVSSQQGGWLDIDTSIEGNLKDGFESSGDIIFRSLDFFQSGHDDKGLRREVLSDPTKPHHGSIKYAMSLKKDSLNFENIQFKVEDLLINGKCSIDGFKPDKATINLDLSIPRLDIDKSKRYIKGKIHSSGASEFFENVIREGELEVKSLKFSGKVKELINLSDPSNFKLLSGVIGVKDLSLDINKGKYPLRRLNGLMTLKDGNLIFSDVTGNYEECRIINLNGSISELVSLPYLRLSIKGDADVRKAKGTLLKDVPLQYKKNIDARAGIVTADIKIIGPLPKNTPPIRIEVDAEAKGLTIHHVQVKLPIENVAGSFHFSPEEILIKKLNGNMRDSKFSIKGVVKDFKSQNPLIDINLYSRLNLSDALTLGLDKIKKVSKAEGVSEINFNLKGRKGDFIVSQTLDLTDSSYRYDVWLEKDKGFPNRIQFDGRVNSDTINIDNLVIFLKTAKIDVKGRVNNYDNPKFILSVSTNEMNITDVVKFLTRAEDSVASGIVSLQLNTVGYLKNIKDTKINGKLSVRNADFKLTYLPMPVYNLNATADFTGDRIFIPSAGGFFGDSPVRFSASVKEFSNPIVEFVLNASSFNFDNFFPSKDITGQTFPPSKEEVAAGSEEKRDSQLGMITWRGKIAVDKGRLMGLPFESLMFDIYYNSEMMKVKNLLLKGFGGSHVEKGWLNWDKEDGVEISLSNKMVNMNIENLYGKLPEGFRDIHGNININSKISGKGMGLGDIKKSMNGNLHIEIHNGNINRFHILSKIFSLLNVYQIFKFKLPDLVTEGMPYNSIIANFEIKNGIAVTEDLLIDSDSIRITTVGEIDIKDKKIDMIIGVQPFQTVDKIISSIPLAGRILTGDKKALIVFYYTVKGDMNDPQITAVPFESLGEGILGVFKRLLLTPQEILSPKK
ncbi:MAG: AsmA-like C-terminal domain-containing protein [Nitrospinae bacterium]|nr:AsmA-like C-terminal domain-containing protein [Nitrospinota bacterium]